MVLVQNTIRHTFYKGEAAVCLGETYDKDDALCTPSRSIKIRIKDTNGTRQVEDADMTAEAVGKYKYTYPIAANAATGAWTFEVITTDGEDEEVSISSGSFIVQGRVA